MAHITDLPLDLLNVILLIVATSSHGARDLTRASATCKMLLTETQKPNIFRMVNFQRLTFTIDDFRMHHHRNDLLCKCARAGNQAAQSIMGKAILVQDPWFMDMLYHDNQLAYDHSIPASEALHHHNLVRTFILNAASQEIVAMRQNLLNYMIIHAGYNAAREYGLLAAICCLCNVEAARHRVPRIVSNQESYDSFIDVLALLEQPNEAVYRDIVIILFDRLFPSARD